MARIMALFLRRHNASKLRALRGRKSFTTKGKKRIRKDEEDSVLTKDGAVQKRFRIRQLHRSADDAPAARFGVCVCDGGIGTLLR